MNARAFQSDCSRRRWVTLPVVLMLRRRRAAKLMFRLHVFQSEAAGAAVVGVMAVN